MYNQWSIKVMVIVTLRSYGYVEMFIKNVLQ
jgi:hypothetical protein